MAKNVICISDNRDWLGEVASLAEQADVPGPALLSWAQFDSNPMAFAHADCWAFAHIDAAQATLDIRLGTLARTFPFGVLLALSSNVDATDQQLFSYGFEKFGGSDEKMAPSKEVCEFLNSSERCFQFRLQDYKAVPDWLNARFWAHPERFNL